MSDHAGHDSEEEAKLPSHPTPHQMASEIALSLLRAEVGDSPPEGSVGEFLKDDDGPSAPKQAGESSKAVVTETAATERPTVGSKGLVGKSDEPPPSPVQNTKEQSKPPPPAPAAQETDQEDGGDLGFPKRFFGQLIDADKKTWYIVAWYTKGLVITASSTDCFKIEGKVKTKHPMLVGFQHHLRGMFAKQAATVLRQIVDPDPVTSLLAPRVIVIVCMFRHTVGRPLKTTRSLPPRSGTSR